MSKFQPFAAVIDAAWIKHHFAGGVYAKEIRIPAGYRLKSHKHRYDHLSVLSSGEALISYGEEPFRVTGPAVVTILAGLEHSLEAITDLVWLCIHATDAADPATADELLIEREAV